MSYYKPSDFKGLRTTYAQEPIPCRPGILRDKFSERPASVPALQQLAAAKGREHGLPASLEFSGSWEGHTYSSVNADLLVAGQLVPLSFRLIDLHNPRLAKYHAELITKAIEVVARNGREITSRIQNVRAAMQRHVDALGCGARLVDCQLKRCSVGEDKLALMTHPVEVIVSLLGSDLCVRDTSIVVRGQRHAAKALFHRAEDQRRRFAALQRRTSRPGYVEVESVAAHLMSICDMTVGQILAVGDCSVNPQESYRSGNMELCNIVFYMVDGHIAVSFDYDCGHFRRGTLQLERTLPALFVHALPGRQIGEVLDAELFQAANPLIVSAEQVGEALYIKLAQNLLWMRI